MSNASPAGAAGGPSGPRASFGVRFIAFLIDILILGAVNLVLSSFVGDTASYGVGALLFIAYFTYFEGQPAGQTLGKKVMSIRVIDYANGGSLDMSKSLVRSIVHYVGLIPCFLGCWWTLFNNEKQGWHDLAAQTVVVPTSAYPVS